MLTIAAMSATAAQAATPPRPSRLLSSMSGLSGLAGLAELSGKGKKVLTRGQIAAAAALTQLGVPFSWGAGSPKGPTLGKGRGSSTRGFDCSGLTLYAWSRAGIRLSHYTGAQFRQGRRVPIGSRRTGDLLFFGGGTGDPTHVAIFLTGGLMIHAPKTGDVVKTTNFLGVPYYRATYRGAIRPA
ncbi:C40 family peptidase [Nonomuraea candida]|uniref:C40 family peptidase n=1 Tax=Nonomuraea candida TaxID=359159 RepID=UPI00146FE152|nr:NlpC/P60 family protein [Nonomuraea candida]